MSISESNEVSAIEARTRLESARQRELANSMFGNTRVPEDAWQDHFGGSIESCESLFEQTFSSEVKGRLWTKIYVPVLPIVKNTFLTEVCNTVLSAFAQETIEHVLQIRRSSDISSDPVAHMIVHSYERHLKKIKITTLNEVYKLTPDLIHSLISALEGEGYSRDP